MSSSDDFREYLSAHKLQELLGRDVNQVVKALVENPFAKIASRLQRPFEGVFSRFIVSEKRLPGHIIYVNLFASYETAYQEPRELPICSLPLESDGIFGDTCSLAARLEPLEEGLRGTALDDLIEFHRQIVEHLAEEPDLAVVLAVTFREHYYRSICADPLEGLGPSKAFYPIGFFVSKEIGTPALLCMTGTIDEIRNKRLELAENSTFSVEEILRFVEGTNDALVYWGVSDWFSGVRVEPESGEPEVESRKGKKKKKKLEIVHPTFSYSGCMPESDAINWPHGRVPKKLDEIVHSCQDIAAIVNQMSSIIHVDLFHPEDGFWTGLVDDSVIILPKPPLCGVDELFSSTHSSQEHSLIVCRYPLLSQCIQAQMAIIADHGEPILCIEELMWAS